MSEVRIALDDGTEFTMTPTELAERMRVRKALPEDMWTGGAIRVIRRGYYNKAGNFAPIYTVVCEMPPSVRRIKYQEGFDQSSAYHGADYKDAVLSFPYVVTVYVIQVNDDGTLVLNRMWPLSFYRNLPLSGYSDDLYVCNMPNVRIDPWNDSAAEAAVGWTCFHNAPKDVTQLRPNRAGSGESELSAVCRMVKKLNDYWWESSFTGSAGAITAWLETAANVRGVSSVDEWAANTAANPDFGVSVEWLPYPNGAKLKDVLLAIDEANGIVKPGGTKYGEPSILAPEGSVSTQRLKAILKADPSVGPKVKQY